MTATTTVLTAVQVEAEVRAFARQFPTPNVARALAYAECGRLSWAAVHEVLRTSLAKGLAKVAA